MAWLRWAVAAVAVVLALLAGFGLLGTGSGPFSQGSCASPCQASAPATFALNGSIISFGLFVAFLGLAAAQLIPETKWRWILSVVGPLVGFGLGLLIFFAVNRTW